MGHAVALVLFAACLALGWWQVQRAGQGSLNSFAYAVEWPVFAGFVAFIWYREVQRALKPPAERESDSEASASSGGTANQSAEQGGTGQQDQQAQRNAPVVTDDPELDEYNRMLAWLNANPHKRISDYPG